MFCLNFWGEKLRFSSRANRTQNWRWRFRQTFWKFWSIICTRIKSHWIVRKTWQIGWLVFDSKFSVKVEQVCQILVLADQLLIEHLKEICEMQIANLGKKNYNLFTMRASHRSIALSFRRIDFETFAKIKIWFSTYFGRKKFHRQLKWNVLTDRRDFRLIIWLTKMCASWITTRGTSSVENLRFYSDVSRRVRIIGIRIDL